MSDDRQLAAWMSRQRRATTLELRCAHRIVYTGERDDHPDDAKWLGEILEAASADAAEQTGRLVYELTASLPSGRSTGSTQWVQRGQRDDAQVDDEATLAAMLKDARRYLEATQKQLLSGFAMTMDQAQRIIASQAVEIADLRVRCAAWEERGFQNAVMREQLLDRSHERDLERAKAARSADLEREALDEIRPAIPLVVGALATRFLGPGAVPPPNVPDALETLIRSLDDATLEKISAALNPGQRLALAKVYESAIDKMSAREAAKQQKQKPTNGAGAPSTE